MTTETPAPPCLCLCCACASQRRIEERLSRMESRLCSLMLHAGVPLRVAVRPPSVAPAAPTPIQTLEEK